MHFKSQIYTKYLTSFPLWNIGSVQNITNEFDLCRFFFFNQWTINYKL